MLALVLIIGAVLPAVPALARDPKLKVVTTVAPHADLIREIAGDRVDLVQLIPDGTDSHTFEPRPSDAAVLHSADLIVLNGLHLETPTQRMADANKMPATPYLVLGDSTISPTDYLFDFSFPE
ncbi:MAG TPA: zinc ABC transporter substrate-binding protein, partial [Mycobacterium sp.]|nr:zinc ABC transporter substrate-binding protein [Mycobacterium sp.]